MNKEEKYSFIIEFDEMTDKQINNLTDYFNNNKIKFHVLKSDYELKKEKEVINKAIEFYENNKQECVVGRNEEGKLIKKYYLPAHLSKPLIDILNEVSE